MYSLAPFFFTHYIMKAIIPGIPQQQEGSESNTTATYDAADSQEATEMLKKMKQRLLDVNHWEKIAVMPSADFTLCDHFGRKVDRLAKEGDYFRINIPGPGNNKGDGFDWVQIQKIEERYSKDEDHILITVKPASDPTVPDNETTHFFSEEASSSFVVQRAGNKLTAAVYGRNEKPNTESEGIIDKIRNTVVAAAAITGFSKIQWKGLVEGLIKKDS